LISAFKWLLQKLSFATKFLWLLIPGLMILGYHLGTVAASMASAAAATVAQALALQTAAAASTLAANGQGMLAAEIIFTTAVERQATVATWGLTKSLGALLVPLAVAVASFFAFKDLLGLTQEGATLAALGVGLLTAALYTMGTALAISTGGLSLLAAGLAMLVTGLWVGFSPSVLDSLDALVFAIYKIAPAIIFITPFLFPLATGLSAVAVAALGLSYAFSTMINDSVVTNLQLMSVEIANVIDKINELSALKAAAFTATMAATTVASAAVALTSPGALTAAVGGGTAAAGAPAAAAPAFTGPPPTINVNLSIDGKEFATVVNSVDVSKYTSGKKSTLYDSVVRMIEQGLTTGKA